MAERGAAASAESLWRAVKATLVHAGPPLDPGRRTLHDPLSIGQERVWRFLKSRPELCSDHLAMTYRVAGRLDVRALFASLETLVRRHEALRATFPAPAGEPVQRLAQPLPGPRIVDLGALRGAAREDRAVDLLNNVVARPTDLERGPLHRFVLIRLHDELSFLGLFFHHLVFDGFSGGIFLRELAALYAGEIEGRPVSLPPLPCRPADFARWQRQALKSDWGNGQLRYWRRQLADLGPPCRLPLDYPRHPWPRYHQEYLCLPMARELVTRLTAIGRQWGTTPFVILLAAFKLLLSRVTALNDIALLSVYANRTRAPFTGVIGFFSNVVLLRSRMPASGDFRALVERVDATHREAFAHQALPFGVIWEEILEPHYRGERRPPFPMRFILQNAGADLPRTGLPGLDVTPITVRRPHDTDELDVSIEVATNADWTAQFGYDPDLFEPATVVHLARDYLALLRRVAANPNRCLERL